MKEKTCRYCGNWNVVEAESGCLVGVYLWEIWGCNECGKSWKEEYRHDDVNDKWVMK